MLLQCRWTCALEGIRLLWPQTHFTPSRNNKLRAVVFEGPSGDDIKKLSTNRFCLEGSKCIKPLSQVTIPKRRRNFNLIMSWIREQSFPYNRQWHCHIRENISSQRFRTNNLSHSLKSNKLSVAHKERKAIKAITRIYSMDYFMRIPKEDGEIRKTWLITTITPGFLLIKTAPSINHALYRFAGYYSVLLSEFVRDGY